MRLVIKNYVHGVEFTSGSYTTKNAKIIASAIVAGTCRPLSIKSKEGTETYFNSQFLSECLVEIHQ